MARRATRNNFAARRGAFGFLERWAMHRVSAGHFHVNFRNGNVAAIPIAFFEQPWLSSKALLARFPSATWEETARARVPWVSLF